MTPEQRFHSYITVATVFLMFVVIKYVEPSLKMWGLVKLFLTLLSTFALYSLLATILLSLSRNWLWLKKHLLGASFLNGTWVGSFKNHQGVEIFTVEFFEQTISSLVIRGEAFNSNGDSHAQWVSKATFINSSDGILTYTYTCDKSDDKSTFQGIGVFNFERQDSHLPPKYIKGYSTDIVDGIRTHNREKKITDKLLDLEDAFNRAKAKGSA